MAKVMYLHGLESGPNAGKALALRAAGFEVMAPALDTSATTALFHANSKDAAALSASMRVPVDQARAAMLSFRPEVIVGSSFGAAVLLTLMHEASYTGALAVLLAGAGPKIAGIQVLPPHVPAILLHGRQDDVIPIGDSRLLAESSPRAVLIEVHDDHRLTSTTASGMLCDVVRLALARRQDG